MTRKRRKILKPDDMAGLRETVQRKDYAERFDQSIEPAKFAEAFFEALCEALYLHNVKVCSIYSERAGRTVLLRLEWASKYPLRMAYRVDSEDIRMFGQTLSDKELVLGMTTKIMHAFLVEAETKREGRQHREDLSGSLEASYDQKTLTNIMHSLGLHNGT